MNEEALRLNSLFLEMGSFKEYGGWVLDTQFIPNMGSAYLLAHGLGVPVQDAKTTTTFPILGKYRVWAFTRDWNAPWKPNMAPGLFEVIVNGQAFQFGNENEHWHWQCGGEIEITERETEVILHDCTGFEGRCAALFFTTDLTMVPPDGIAELTNFRRTLCGNDTMADCGHYDIVVAGGGIAGICAALSSAKNGLTVALIQDRPVVGGNNSSEVRVWLGGDRNFEPFPNIGNIVAELEQEKEAHYGKENTAEIYEDEKNLLY